MKCRTARREISTWLDGRIEPDQAHRLRAHLADCAACTLYLHQIQNLKSALAELEPVKPSAEVTTALQVLASRARLEQLRRQDPAARWQEWRARAGLWVENLMRPFALPVGGGLAVALLIFALMAPMYAIHDRYGVADVPTVLSTGPSLESTLSFGLSGDDIVIEVLIDHRGKMLDYAIVQGHGWTLSPALRKSIENTLLCTKFIPATTFGQPKSSKLRITLRGDEVEVKG